jgi:hypothetical protein
MSAMQLAGIPGWGWPGSLSAVSHGDSGTADGEAGARLVRIGVVTFRIALIQQIGLLSVPTG